MLVSQQQTMDWMPGMLNGTMGDVGVKVSSYLSQHPQVKRRGHRPNSNQVDDSVGWTFLDSDKEFGSGSCAQHCWRLIPVCLESRRACAKCGARTAAPTSAPCTSSPVPEVHGLLPDSGDCLTRKRFKLLRGQLLA